MPVHIDQGMDSSEPARDLALGQGCKGLSKELNYEKERALFHLELMGDLKSIPISVPDDPKFIFLKATKLETAIYKKIH